MKLRSPRPSFSIDYTPKQWIGLYNILILLLVAAMCGMVIYEVYDLNRKFVTIIDSSVVAIDLLATNLINSKMAPYWRIVNEDVSVYSAFYKKRAVDDSIILIIGASSNRETYVEDLRCIVKYDDDEDINIVEATYEKFSNCSTFLVSCLAKDSSTPKKVILISHGDTFSKKWIEIETISSDVNQTGIAACVRPFDGNISTKQIEEFVTFYEMIGLKNFFFYNYNATQGAVQFIHKLIDAGHSIHMLTWNKKMEPSNSCQISWYEYVQDCVHRALRDHTNVLTVGINDLFVPEKYFNLLDLLKSYSNNSYAQLQVLTANYCNAPNQDVFHPSVRNMVFRGPFRPSNANYFLRSEMTAAIELYGSFPSKNIRKLTETLPEYEGVVRHLAKECDSNVTFDALAYKYFKLMDKSIVLEKARINEMKKSLPRI